MIVCKKLSQMAWVHKCKSPVQRETNRTFTPAGRDSSVNTLRPSYLEPVVLCRMQFSVPHKLHSLLPVFSEAGSGAPEGRGTSLHNFIHL